MKGLLSHKILYWNKLWYSFKIPLDSCFYFDVIECQAYAPEIIKKDDRMDPEQKPEIPSSESSHWSEAEIKEMLRLYPEFLSEGYLSKTFVQLSLPVHVAVRPRGTVLFVKNAPFMWQRGSSDFLSLVAPASLQAIAQHKFNRFRPRSMKMTKSDSGKRVG